MNVSPGFVISIAGTGVGIITCFVLPIWIHLRCFKPKASHNQSMITDGSFTNTNLINQSEVESHN